MELTFYGAAGTVTPSCTLLEHRGMRILIDMGIAQGVDREKVPDLLPFEPGSISCVILTHAHMDHSGRIPLLVKEGFKGTVYSTDATREICEILLSDSASDDGLYNMSDVYESMKRFKSVPYGKSVEIGDGIGFTLFDAGHLLGSASVMIHWGSDILFSGDIGNTNVPMLKDPCFPGKAEYVVMESTYGGRVHSLKAETQREALLRRARSLAETAKRTIESGGNLVIPVFAVGRAQEILYLFRMIHTESIVPYEIPVFLDSPLSAKATALYMKSMRDDYLDEEAEDLIERGINPIIFPSFRAVGTTEESKSLNSMRGIVILASSGMCDGGRVRHHLKHNLPRKNSTILFTGYQAEGTLGYRILTERRKTVSIFGEEIPVNASIEVLEGTSGHADSDALMKWLESAGEPKAVFLNHGSEEARKSLGDRIRRETDLDVILPSLNSRIELIDSFKE